MNNERRGAIKWHVKQEVIARWGHSKRSMVYLQAHSEMRTVAIHGVIKKSGRFAKSLNESEDSPLKLTFENGSLNLNWRPVFQLTILIRKIRTCSIDVYMFLKKELTT